MAVHIFIAKTQQEFLTAQATLKRNEFVCRTKLAKAHCSKESTGLTASSRVGEPNRLHAKKLSRLPGYPSCRGETTRLLELSRPHELSHPPRVNGWYNFLSKWVEKYLAQGNSGEG